MRPIILEGPDHVGKTRAAQLIRSITGAKIVHAGIEEGKTFSPERWLEGLKSWRIYDRYHIGQFVYGHVLGLHDVPDGYNWHRFMYLCREIQRNATVVILTCSDEEQFIKRLEENGKDEAFHPEYIRRANFIYRDLWSVIDHAHDVSHRFPTREDVERWIS